MADIAAVRTLYHRTLHVRLFFSRDIRVMQIEDTSSYILNDVHVSKNPRMWALQAYNLWIAADAVGKRDKALLREVVQERKVPRTPAYFLPIIERMLLGLSLENLVKAVLLKDPKNHKDIFGTRGKISWFGICKHDLLALFARANIELTAPQQQLLGTLSAAAGWAARYPLKVGRTDRGNILKRFSRLVVKATETLQRITRTMKKFDPAEVNYDNLHESLQEPERQEFTRLFRKLEALTR